jgi:hypothetical protein
MSPPVTPLPVRPYPGMPREALDEWLADAGLTDFGTLPCHFISHAVSAADRRWLETTYGAHRSLVVPAPEPELAALQARLLAFRAEVRPSVRPRVRTLSAIPVAVEPDTRCVRVTENTFAACSHRRSPEVRVALRTPTWTRAFENLDRALATSAAVARKRTDDTTIGWQLDRWQSAVMLSPVKVGHSKSGRLRLTKLALADLAADRVGGARTSTCTSVANTTGSASRAS